MPRKITWTFYDLSLGCKYIFTCSANVQFDYAQEMTYAEENGISRMPISLKMRQEELHTLHMEPLSNHRAAHINSHVQSNNGSGIS
jgi:hypothetical protein